MTKTEARRYAKRLIVGYIEHLFHSEDAPLVYDEFSKDDLQGRRLSSADFDRACDAVETIRKRLDHQSFTDKESMDRNKGLYYRAAGKPGARWKGYEAWLKRQGRA